MGRQENTSSLVNQERRWKAFTRKLPFDDDIRKFKTKEKLCTLNFAKNEKKLKLKKREKTIVLIDEMTFP